MLCLCAPRDRTCRAALRRVCAPRGGSRCRYGIVDYLREFDEDADMQISSVEFRRAIALLGYRVAREDADGVFALFDRDSSGFISVRELKNALRRDVEAEKKRVKLIRAAETANVVAEDESTLREEVMRTYKEACAAAKLLLDQPQPYLQAKKK
jgi:hypothetical protein